MLTTAEGTELEPRKDRVSALLRGIMQAYATSLLPYGVAVSIFLILAAVAPPFSYAIFLVWYAYLLCLGLILAAPFFAWPLRQVPVGSTFSTSRSLWAALGIFFTGFVLTAIGAWIVSLF